MANLARSRVVYSLVGKLNNHLLNHQPSSSLGLCSKLPFLPNSPNANPVIAHLRSAYTTSTFNPVLPRPKPPAAANHPFLLNQQFRSMCTNKGFSKQHKGTTIKGVSYKGNPIAFGRYALQVLEPARITSRQIKAGRLALTRTARRGGKIWVRVFPNKPVTAKPAEVRMGRGKGSLAYWAAVVKPGRILYEMSGVSEDIAKRAILIAASKIPIRTQFISSGNE